MPAIDWNRILEKAQSWVESYKKKQLCMPFKILLLNVAVFPLVFYLASTFVLPKSVVDMLLTLAVDFIWSLAKKQMISKQFFYLDKCRSGWDLLHTPSKTESLLISDNLSVGAFLNISLQCVVGTYSKSIMIMLRPTFSGEEIVLLFRLYCIV